MLLNHVKGVASFQCLFIMRKGGIIEMKYMIDKYGNVTVVQDGLELKK